MITHGILAGVKYYDIITHLPNDSSKLVTQRKYEKLSWASTLVFDNSNQGKKAIYKEKWC